MSYDLECKAEAAEFLKQLDEPTQRKAAQAITQLMKEDPAIGWDWITCALKKKSKANWELFGFGIFWNYRFQASVYKQLERNQIAEEIDLDEFYKLV